MLIEQMYLNLKSLAQAYEIRHEVLLFSCNVILLYNFGLVA